MGEAIKLFDDMVGGGVRPDGVTFIALLSGCSHAGLADLGEELFQSMTGDFGIRPSLRDVVKYLCKCGDVGWIVLHDVSEETKPEWICGHSERLATVYGLIQTGPGVQMRLFLNSNENVGNRSM
ncbi:hypothetical protein P3S67_027048 [Capsicum chacoense]